MENKRFEVGWCHESMGEVLDKGYWVGEVIGFGTLPFNTSCEELAQAICDYLNRKYEEIKCQEEE